MAKGTKRRVKLHSKYREVSRSWQGNDWRAIPWLNVSGLWLEQAGFKAGDAVEITVAQHTLIIKNCSTDGDRDH